VKSQKTSNSKPKTTSNPDVKQPSQPQHVSHQMVGCDAAFGSDQGFLDGLPLGVYYFASVKENQYLSAQLHL